MANDDFTEPIITTTTATTPIEAVSGGNNGGDAAAGGIVRGFVRSIIGRFTIGQLPKAPAPRIPQGFSWGSNSTSAINVLRKQRVPVKQVARVSDRISTGLDWISSAQEASSDATPTNNERNNTAASYFNKKSAYRLFSLTGSILKNSLLGAIVFESYGYTISSFANTIPLSTTGSSTDEFCNPKQQSIAPMEDNQLKGSNIHSSPQPNTRQNDDYITVGDEITDSILRNEEDDYAKVPINSHFAAGFVAGTVHGIGGSLLDYLSNQISSKSFYSPLWKNNDTKIIWESLGGGSIKVLHHSIAHSILFGSYESIKRCLLHSQITVMNEFDYSIDSDGDFGIDIEKSRTNALRLNAEAAYYLLSVGTAGGIAGQIQHIISHYTEQFESSMIFAKDGLVRFSANSSRTSFLQTMYAPTLRSVLLAFPPSAIGFIAFEYGKQITQ